MRAHLLRLLLFGFSGVGEQGWAELPRVPKELSEPADTSPARL